MKVASALPPPVISKIWRRFHMPLWTLDCLISDMSSHKWSDRGAMEKPQLLTT